MKQYLKDGKHGIPWEDAAQALNDQDEKGLSLLLLACEVQHVPLIRLLIEQPVIDINITANDAGTALSIAAQLGNIEALKLLLKNENIDLEKQQKGSPLHAVGHSYWRSQTDQQVTDEVSTMHLLISHGFDVNHLDKNGATPLHSHVRHEHSHLVKTLLDTKLVDITIRENFDTFGKTALFDACSMGLVAEDSDLNVVDLLLNYGAIHNVVETDLEPRVVESPEAVRSMIAQICKSVSNRGLASLKCRWSSIAEAVYNGNENVVTTLVSHWKKYFTIEALHQAHLDITFHGPWPKHVHFQQRIKFPKTFNSKTIDTNLLHLAIDSGVCKMIPLLMGASTNELCYNYLYHTVGMCLSPISTGQLYPIACCLLSHAVLISNDDATMTKVLLDHCSLSPNFVSKREKALGFSALTVAIAMGYVNVMNVLLDYSPLLPDKKVSNIKDNNLVTSLWAPFFFKEENFPREKKNVHKCISILLANGANPNIRMNTSIDYTGKNYNTRDFTEKNSIINGNYTILYAASVSGDHVLVDLLLNFKDLEGEKLDICNGKNAKVDDGTNDKYHESPWYGVCKKLAFLQPPVHADYVQDLFKTAHVLLNFITNWFWSSFQARNELNRAPNFNCEAPISILIRAAKECRALNDEPFEEDTEKKSAALDPRPQLLLNLIWALIARIKLSDSRGVGGQKPTSFHKQSEPVSHLYLSCFKEQRNIQIQFIRTHVEHRSIKDASKVICQDKFVVKYAITNIDGFELNYADESLKQDPELIELATKHGRLDLATKEQLRDITFLKSAVQNSCQSVSTLPADLRNDKELLSLLLASNHGALAWLSTELQDDKDFILGILHQGVPILIAEEADSDKYFTRYLKNTKLHKNVKQLLRYCSSRLQQDVEVVREAVGLAGENLQFASKEMKSNPNIVRVAVAQNGLSLQFGSKEMKSDKDIVRRAVAQNGLALKFANEDLKRIPSIVIQAVTRTGMALEYAHEDLQGCISVADCAVKQDGCALQFPVKRWGLCPNKILTDESSDTYYKERAEDENYEEYEESLKSLCLAAITSPTATIEQIMEIVPVNFKRDKPFAIKVLSLDGHALEHLSFFNDDDNCVLTAVKQTGSAICHASTRLEHREDMVLLAIQTNEEAVKGVTDRDVIMKAVAQKGCVLNYVEDVFKNDKEIVRAAVQNDGYAIDYASDKWRNNREMLLIAVANNHPDLHDGETCLEWMSDELKDDYDVAKMAVSCNPNAYYDVSDRLKKKHEIALLFARHKFWLDFETVEEWMPPSLLADPDFMAKVRQ